MTINRNAKSRNTNLIAGIANEEQIEWLNPASLKPPETLVRVHPKSQLRLLKKSVREDGICNPILIDEDNAIISGVARHAVAVELGLDAVPCRRVSGRSARWKRQYPIADNAIAEKAAWDKAKLAQQFKFELEFGCDVELMGFEQAEVDQIVCDADEASTAPSGPEDDHPTPPPLDEAVTQLGDLWELGRHRLICGDAADRETLSSLLGDERAQVAFVDPPYNLPIAGHVSGKGKLTHREFPQGSGELSAAEFTAHLTRWLEALEAYCANGAIVYSCMDRGHLLEILTAGYAVFSELKNVVVWVKTNAGMGTFYRSQYEPILVWKVGDAPQINTFGLGQGGRHRSNVWTYAGVNAFKHGRMEELALHPTVKPVALVADALRDVSHRGHIVLDTFGGSGTTLIAAEKTGRRARLVELDPPYCDTIVRRWQKLTGKSATLLSTGHSFEDVEESRFRERNPGWGSAAA